MSIFYTPPPLSKKERLIRFAIVFAVFSIVIILGLIGNSDPFTIPFTFAIAIFFSVFVIMLLANSSDRTGLRVHLDLGERQVIIEKHENQDVRRLKYDIEYFIGFGFSEADVEPRSRTHLPVELHLKFNDAIHDHERPSLDNLLSETVQEIEGTKVLFWKTPLWKTQHPTTTRNAHDITSEANKWLQKYLWSEGTEASEFLEKQNIDYELSVKPISKTKRDFKDID